MDKIEESKKIIEAAMNVLKTHNQIILLNGFVYEAFSCPLCGEKAIVKSNLNDGYVGIKCIECEISLEITMKKIGRN